ncbi:MAG: hypothetical protein D6824_05535 [Planctomycetota bacterium]|nr:MAG: hypothetical protein D6824_05535 [Planctomycetota bacterium]
MTHPTKAQRDQGRAERNGFRFPQGVQPVDPLAPTPGYVVSFEQADGGGDEGWEEWPDRYVYEAVVSADRLASLARALFALLPSRVHPILDVLSEDVHRDVDPYIAYERVGLDRFFEEFEALRDWLLEDGLVGFGAMAEEPFLYVYIDEHKIVTVRCEASLRPVVEQTLGAFDLEELDELAAVDAVEHEHLSVLPWPEERAPALSPFEARLETLCDAWKLVLNLDDVANVDEEGRPVGVTPWKLLIRVGEPGEPHAPRRFETVVLASSLRDAYDASLEAIVDYADHTPTHDLQPPPGSESDHSSFASEPADSLEGRRATLLSAVRLLLDPTLRQAVDDASSDAARVVAVTPLQPCDQR